MSKYCDKNLEDEIGQFLSALTQDDAVKRQIASVARGWTAFTSFVTALGGLVLGTFALAPDAKDPSVDFVVGALFVLIGFVYVLIYSGPKYTLVALRGRFMTAADVFNWTIGVSSVIFVVLLLFNAKP